MKNSKIVGAFLAIVIILQNMLFLGYDEFFIFPFALGMPEDVYDITNVILIIILLSPVFFIHFYFSESIKRLIYGYGKIYIIRKYSRTRLMMKEIGRIFITLVFIIIIQTIFAYLFKDNLKNLSVAVVAASLGAYLLGTAISVLLQMYLEFYIEPQQAAIISCVYLFISYCMANTINDNYLIKIIFFPSLMFGTINGAMGSLNQYIASILILLVLGICLIFANLYKFKKSDIF